MDNKNKYSREEIDQRLSKLSEEQREAIRAQFKELTDALDRNSPYKNLFWEFGGECIYRDDPRLKSDLTRDQLRESVESKEEVLELQNPLEGERGPVTCFRASMAFVQWCYDIAPHSYVKEILPLFKPLSTALVKNQVNLARLLEKDLLFQTKNLNSVGAAAGMIGVRVGDPAAYTVICCFGLQTPPVHWNELVRGITTEKKEMRAPHLQMKRSFEDARKCTMLREQRLLEEGNIMAAWQLRQIFKTFLDGLRDRLDEDKRRSLDPTSAFE